MPQRHSKASKVPLRVPCKMLLGLEKYENSPNLPNLKSDTRFQTCYESEEWTSWDVIGDIRIILESDRRVAHLTKVIS